VLQQVKDDQAGVQQGEQPVMYSNRVPSGREPQHAQATATPIRHDSATVNMMIMTSPSAHR